MKRKARVLWLITGLLALVLTPACSNGHNERRESGDREHSEEHGAGGENGSESRHDEKSEGSEIGANALGLNDTYDAVGENGARLVLRYDSNKNVFTGTVQNNTANTLTRIRVEVHLSNGDELGPTTPTDLAPHETMSIILPAGTTGFSGWTAHAEAGNSENGGAEGGSIESDEADMSSRIVPLTQTWTGILGGLAVEMAYDAATRSIYGTVKNITSQQLCYVQSEPHLKKGSKTVGELGPDKLGHLNPGQQASSRLYLNNEPELTGISFDGYVIHMEVFDCSGPGPTTHGSGESGESPGHAEGNEGGRN